MILTIIPYLRLVHYDMSCPSLLIMLLLLLYRSNTNIYAQIIDDTKGVTLVSASTLDKELASL